MPRNSNSKSVGLLRFHWENLEPKTGGELLLWYCDGACFLWYCFKILYCFKTTTAWYIFRPSKKGPWRVWEGKKKHLNPCLKEERLWSREGLVWKSKMKAKGGGGRLPKKPAAIPLQEISGNSGNKAPSPMTPAKIRNTRVSTVRSSQHVAPRDSSASSGDTDCYGK